MSFGVSVLVMTGAPTLNPDPKLRAFGESNWVTGHFSACLALRRSSGSFTKSPSNNNGNNKSSNKKQWTSKSPSNNNHR